jgi:hypothetical protein
MTKLYKFYLPLWLLYPKAIAEKAAEQFHFLLASSLIFEMSISGGSANKRQRYLFFGTYCMVFIFRKNVFCSTEDFRVCSHFFVSYLFCLLKFY